MTTKKEYSRGYGDRFPQLFTSGRCIWEACIVFQAKNGVPPTPEYIKSLNLIYKGKKGEQRLVNPNNVAIELNSYKSFLKRFPGAKELEPLKKP